jgi:hypothetical protein
MAHCPTHDSGQPAPSSATYEQMNVFGTPTGIRVRVRRGHLLPDVPMGHEWAVVEEHPEGIVDGDSAPPPAPFPLSARSSGPGHNIVPFKINDIRAPISDSALPKNRAAGRDRPSPILRAPPSRPEAGSPRRRDDGQDHGRAASEAPGGERIRVDVKSARGGAVSGGEAVEGKPAFSRPLQAPGWEPMTTPENQGGMAGTRIC